MPRERECAGVKRAVGIQIRAHAAEEVEQPRLIVADRLLEAVFVDPRHELVLVREVPVERAAVDLRVRAQVGHGDVRQVVPEHAALEALGDHFFRRGLAHGGRLLSCCCCQYSASAQKLQQTLPQVREILGLSKNLVDFRRRSGCYLSGLQLY